MPCATVNRWFVPDQEFDSMTEDYALVGETAERISQELFAYDNETEHTWARYKTGTLDDRLAQLSALICCYDFAVTGSLVYADVNQSDPEHKQKVYGKIAKEPRLGEENDKVVALKKEPVKFLMTRYQKYRDPEDSEDEDNSKEQAVECLTRAIGTSQLDPQLVDFFIQYKDQKGMQAVLNILSNQSMRKNPRPVMLLVGMIDKAKTDKRGLTEGWAVGYDFLKGLLIIKPFVSKKGHHPLGDKWHDKAVNDGISFMDSPVVFAEKFVKLGDQVEGKTEVDGLKLVVHTYVADWIVEQWKGFNLADPNKWTDALRKSIRAARKKINANLKERRMTITDKVGERKGPMEGFEYLANKLAVEEPSFRDSALEARKIGNEKAAQNAADFYERLTKDLKSFNEDPDNQF